MKISRALHTSFLSLSLSSAAFFICGCTTDECLGNKSSIPLAGFYSSYFPGQALQLDSLTVYGVGAKDSLLINSMHTSQTYLPLRIDADNTSFVFHFKNPESEYNSLSKNDFLTDTLTLYYERQPYFVSSACGAMYNYTIKSVKSSYALVDSVSTPTGVIDNQDIENVRIYFRLYPFEP